MPQWVMATAILDASSALYIYRARPIHPHEVVSQSLSVKGRKTPELRVLASA